MRGEGRRKKGEDHSPTHHLVRGEPGAGRDYLPFDDSFRAKGKEEYLIWQWFHLPSHVFRLPDFLTSPHIKGMGTFGGGAIQRL